MVFFIVFVVTNQPLAKTFQMVVMLLIHNYL
jgi:hypothetical protein